MSRSGWVACGEWTIRQQNRAAHLDVGQAGVQGPGRGVAGVGAPVSGHGVPRVTGVQVSSAAQRVVTHAGGSWVSALDMGHMDKLTNGVVCLDVEV